MAENTFSQTPAGGKYEQNLNNKELLELLQATIDSSLDMIQVFRAVRDEKQEIIDFIWILNNKTSEEFYGNVIGKSLLALNPGVVKEGIFETFKKVVETGDADQSVRHYVHEQFDGWFLQSTVKQGDGVATTTKDITETNAAKELVQTVFDIIINPIAYHKAVRDSTGRIIDFELQLENQKAREHAMNGRTGQRCSEAYPGIRDSLVFEKYCQVVETGASLDTEVELKLKGSNYWFHLLAAKLGDGLVASAADVTQRKHAEAEILRLKDEITQRTEEKYRMLFNSIDEGFSLLELIFNDDGKVVDYWHRDDNPSFIRMTGIKNPINKRMSDLVPNLEPEWHKMLEQVYYTGEPIRTEYKVQQLGQWYTCYLSRVGDSGSPFIAAVYDDITDRKQRELDQEFLLKLSDSLRTEITAGAVANRALQLLIDHMQLDRSYITSYCLDENRAHLDYQLGNDTVAPLPDHFVLSDYPEAFKAVSGETLVIEDELERQGLSKDEIKNSGKLGMRAMIAATVRRGSEKPLWSMAAVSSQARRWKNHEVRLVEEAAERTWAALERAEAEESLRIAEERYRIALDSAKMGTWDWNVKDDQILWNEQHYLLLGLQPDQLLKPADYFLQFVYADDLEMVKKQLMQALQYTGQYHAEAFRIIRPDGKIRWMSGYGRTVTWEQDRSARIVGVMFDITHRKLLEQQKEQFISIASHELRTPVTSIKAYAEILEDQFVENGDLQSAGLMRKMDIQIDRLTSLIYALLDSSLITEGRLPLKKEEFDLNQLLIDTIENMQRIAGSHSIRMELEPDIRIFADEERIRQVLINLITNAVKYSPEAEKVIVHLASLTKEVRICVQDFGIGIDEQVQHHLFEPFFRSSDAAGFSGIGLGLFISAGIVRQHGGSIWVESRQGEGAKFCFTIPAPGR